MKTSEMVARMCRQELSAIDMKAISKARGFSRDVVSSRELLENIFLSDIGVAAALATLPHDQVIFLHLLGYMNESVEISFFEPVFSEAGAKSQKSYFYQTPTKRYGGLLKKVKSALIPKGILVMAERDTWRTVAKIERLRFMFPREFIPFLPPILPSTREFEIPGQYNDGVIRKKLEEITGPRRSRPESPSTKRDHTIRISSGRLLIGDKNFKREHLTLWQQDCWNASLPGTREGEKNIVSICAAVHYALSRLRDGEWVLPEALSPILRIFCDMTDRIELSRICEIGWKWGCLSKHTSDGLTYYRPAPEPEDEKIDPGRYLDTRKDGPVVIDLSHVPIRRLEILAKISRMKVASSALAAEPDIIKIGNASAKTMSHPVIQWLAAHSGSYSEAMKTVSRRKGKHVLHENLMIARVADLSLRVRIEKSFPGKIVVFSEEFIAFPRGLTGKVTSLVAKSGFAVKTVEGK